MSERRIAVVVAAGVGDKPRSDAAESIANGLSMFQGFDPPEEHAEWFMVPGDEIRPVARFATARHDKTVDLYEFWWADLSRFPAASRSFLAAFLGLFLALPTLGRTALRNTTEITAEPQGRPTGGWIKNLDFHLLGFLSWLVAVPVVVLSAQLLTTVGAVAIAIALPESSISGAFGVGLYGAALSVVGLLLLWEYEQKSGRRGAFALGFVALGGAATLCAVRLAERGVGGKSIELALADTVTAFVAYPLRILWLVVLVAAVAVTCVLAGKLAWQWRDRCTRTRAVKQTVTAAVTLGGPLGIALLMAILSAAVGGAAQKVSQTVVWQGPSQTPWCLPHPDSWTLSRCPTISAWQFGSLNLEDAIFAMACAFTVVLAVIVVYLIVVLGGAARRWLFRAPDSTPASRQAARISLALHVLGGSPAAVVLLVAGLVAAYAAAAAWLPFLWLPEGIRSQAGNGPMQTTVQTGWPPLIAAIMGGLVTVLVLLARGMGVTPSKLVSGGKAAELMRLILDKPYDIATFLREPVGTANRPLIHLDAMPRRKMLDRYRALLEHISRRGYQKVVFVAHSQGSILTVTLLNDKTVSLPGRVSLMTFGCPLRQLYHERFPWQYRWVGQLAQPGVVEKFVKRVNERWINLGTAGDPVGRTVFADVPDPWVEGQSATIAGPPYLEDLRLGVGGHSSYWKAEPLYTRLADLIDA